MAADPALRMRMGMLAKVDDPVVAEKLRAQYLDAEQRMTSRGGLVLSRWGRTTRTPISTDHLTSLFNVLMEGWALRHRLDPERYPPDVYAYACVALLFTLTAARDDPRDLDTVCSAMNWFSQDGDRVREAERQERGASTFRPLTIDSPRPRITPLDIAVLTRRLITQRPWQDVTIEEVAVAAGVDPDDVLRHFGSKHGLGIGVFLLLADEAFAVIPRGLDPITELREMLRVATDLMMRSVALAQSCVLVFSGMSESYAPGAITWGTIPRIYGTIAAAQEAGQLSPDLDPEDFGATLLRSLLLHIRPLTTHPDRSEVGAIELLLLGAGAPSPEPVALDEAPARHLRTIN
jgi:AcrR family transcriptional regulator